MNLVFASGFLFPQHVGPIEYFNGVKGHVEAQGHTALTHVVPALGKSKVRASALAAAIRGAPFDQGSIHIIAHSMGGLDSRYLIADNPDLAARIASLTTLSTPHHGSPIADLLAGGKPFSLLGFDFGSLRRRAYDAVSSAIGGLKIVETGAIGDLTRAGAEAAPDIASTHRQIACLSYAGVGRARAVPTSGMLAGGYLFILSAPDGGPNDGAVTVTSSRYGAFQETWPCDHLDEVGHDLDLGLTGFAFDHIARIDGIIAKLKALPARL